MNKEITFLKKKRKAKNLDYYLKEKFGKNELREEDEYDYASGSDLDKSIISSSSELNEEIVFGKNFSNKNNENFKKCNKNS